MGRRLVSTRVADEAGNVLGGSGTEVRFFDDEALTTLSTVYRASSGGGTQPNPLTPYAGKQTTLTSNAGSGDTVITVADVAGFAVGNYIPVEDGTNTVYRVVTAINAGAKQLTLHASLGVAFSSGARVGNADVTGHLWAWLDDSRDYFIQVKDVASGRVLPPINIPTQVPLAATSYFDEGTSTGAARPGMNVVGTEGRVLDDAPNNRVTVRVRSVAWVAGVI